MNAIIMIVLLPIQLVKFIWWAAFHYKNGEEK